ncbi:MAG TPA: sugar transferase [Bryobacteraceae bacterium]|nr:sugar transferase [Bryobacteraceae bacterium]
MYVRNPRLYHVWQILLDLIALAVIWQVTIELRIRLNPVAMAEVTHEAVTFWAPSLGWIALIWLVLSLRFRLYRSPAPIHILNSIIWILESAILLCVVTVFVTFFSRQFGSEISRLFVLAQLPAAFICLGISRAVGFSAMKLFEARWSPPRRIALLGDQQNAVRLIQRMRATAFGTSIRGLILPKDVPPESAKAPVPVLGTTTQLAELINQEALDQIVLLNGSVTGEELDACSQVFQRMGVAVSCSVDFLPENQRFNLTTEYGTPLVEIVPMRFTRAQEIVKRIFDVAIAGTLLVLLSPLMIAIAIFVKFTSEGPMLYKSPRVGKGGRYFTFLKFRSMYVNNSRETVGSTNEKGGHIFKMKNDPRVTPVGRFLRRYSLDELPQLINVLRGEMSLVGPRPLPAQDLDPDGMSRQFMTWAEGRSAVHPGITGLWQISGRSELSFEEMVRLDLEYIRTQSIFLDLKIILETPTLVLKGVGAY